MSFPIAALAMTAEATITIIMAVAAMLRRKVKQGEQGGMAG